MTGLAVFLLLASLRPATPQEPVVVGSKGFTESVVLGELARLALEDAGFPARHRAQLGGSRILWEALRGGEIDVYPEYTGTLAIEILGLARNWSWEELASALEEVGVVAGPRPGFANNYALGLRRETARDLGLARISELARHESLRLGFSNEFLDRRDGWPQLRRVYGLPQRPRGLDHDLAYRALASGGLDVIDLYTTDAEIPYYDLVLLEDDRQAFPSYEALYLVSGEAARRPGLLPALGRLGGTLDEAAVRRLNAAVKLEGRGEEEVAAAFLVDRLGMRVAAASDPLLRRLLRRTAEHVLLVALSLLGAILLALPLGILGAHRPRLGQTLLGAAGLLQTVPALALLVVLIPLLGIGTRPALAALFLYSLLPILRNTITGLRGIPRALRESAVALGLPPAARLRRVELPLAMPAVLAGIQTAAVINVGTATLGALVGSGGYGQPILTGIRLADTGLILEGAVPAAALALAVQGLFELLGRRLVSSGLRPVRGLR